MRAIGEIRDVTAARKFHDILYAQGIAAELDRSETNGWTIWVKAEEDCAQATELLQAFMANSADPQFRNAGAQAETLRKRAEEDQASYERRVTQARRSFVSLKGYGFGPLTYALIFVCGLVFVLTKFGKDFDPVNALWFSTHYQSGTILERLLGVPELRQGEVWRLLTPIFIHMGFMHIVFNLLWVADLGSMIESRGSTWLLARLVVVIGVGSNIAQYAVTGRPHFGGMSGVVYGLIGYIWIRGKFDPACGLRLHQQTVVTALLWFVFCFTGYAGAIANSAHAAGLLLGMAWGWLASRRLA